MQSNMKGHDKTRPKHVTRSPATKAFEGSITHETIDILNKIREALGNSRTPQQIQIDKLMRLIIPKFAFDNLGTDQLPVHWEPGLTCTRHHWWPCFLHEIMPLIHGYYEAIREGESELFETAKRRWAMMLKVGIDQYKLAPVPQGFVLMTQGEWDNEKLRRDAILAARHDRLGRRHEETNDDDSSGE